MLWGKQHSKQETVLAQENPAPAFLPSRQLSCLVSSDSVGVTTKWGGGIDSSWNETERCSCNSEIQTTLPAPNYTIQTRKVSRVAADSGMRESRGENGRRKPRREAGCSGKPAEK